MGVVPSTEGENYTEAQQGGLPGITVEDGRLAVSILKFFRKLNGQTREES